MPGGDDPLCNDKSQWAMGMIVLVDRQVVFSLCSDFSSLFLSLD